MMFHPYADTVKTYRPLSELTPVYWKSDDVMLSNGAILHYQRTGGEKPPIILIHGFQVDGCMWLRTAIMLQDQYDVIMPDVAGHGLSSMMPSDLTKDTLSDDIQELIDLLNLQQKPIVVGHSMGADIATRIATETELERIILVDPPLKNFMKMMPPIGDTLPDYMQPIVDTIHSLESLPHPERMVAGLNLLLPGSALWDEMDYVSFVEEQSRFDVTSYKRSRAMGYVVDSPELIARITCPILLLTAKSMMLQPDEFQQGVAVFTQNWRRGQHIHMEESGHFIPFDQFERFIKVSALLN
jgi:N-formylmaleamate deformylase